MVDSSLTALGHLNVETPAGPLNGQFATDAAVRGAVRRRGYAAGDVTIVNPEI